VLAEDGRTVVLAADHRARGVITIESYAAYKAALRAALAHCDALMASRHPLTDLQADLGDRPGYLSLNRAGLAGTVFELDDRLVASVESAVAMGCRGAKIMTRIDRDHPSGAAQLELLGRIVEECAAAGLALMVEPLSWTSGGMDRTTEGIAYAAIVAHDIGAPLLKVPVPNDVPEGDARVEAVARIVGAVGVPVLFLGGPRGSARDVLLGEVRDAMAGGGAGLAIGRGVYQDEDASDMARRVAELVHPGR
jgi:DhnA family fructose-bisphosphate aldolase class Ia